MMAYAEPVAKKRRTWTYERAGERRAVFIQRLTRTHFTTRWAAAWCVLLIIADEIISNYAVNLKSLIDCWSSKMHQA